DALHLPLLFALFAGERLGGLTVGLRAAAKAEEVVVEAFVVRVDLGTTLVAHAFVPGAAAVDAVVLTLEPRLVVALALHDLVGVTRQIGDPIGAVALGLAAVPYAFP